jgi:hypothetical protein
MLFGIISPDSCLMRFIGTIARVVMPARMAILFFLGYSFILPP